MSTSTQSVSASSSALADTSPANDSASAPTPADDSSDHELRQLVAHTLERNGVLPKLRAQLRASVFLALDDNVENRQQVVDDNDENAAFGAVVQAQKRLRGSEIERLCISLVRDWLQSLRLDYTLSVLNSEVGGANIGHVTDQERPLVSEREYMVDALAVNTAGDTDNQSISILSRLIDERLQSQQQHRKEETKKKEAEALALLKSDDIESGRVLAATDGLPKTGVESPYSSAPLSGLSASSASARDESNPGGVGVVSPPATLSSPTPPPLLSRSLSPPTPPPNNNSEGDEDSFFDSLPRSRPAVPTGPGTAAAGPSGSSPLNAGSVSEGVDDSWSDSLSRDAPQFSPDSGAVRQLGAGRLPGSRGWDDRNDTLGSGAERPPGSGDWDFTSGQSGNLAVDNTASSVSEELETPVLESLDSATLSDGSTPHDLANSPDLQLETGFVGAT